MAYVQCAYAMTGAAMRLSMDYQMRTIEDAIVRQKSIHCFSVRGAWAESCP